MLLPRGQSQQINSCFFTFNSHPPFGFGMGYPSEKMMNVAQICCQESAGTQWQLASFGTGANPSWPLQMLSHKAAAHDLNGPLLCGPLTLCSAVEPWVFEVCFSVPKIATLRIASLPLFAASSSTRFAGIQQWCFGPVRKVAFCHYAICAPKLLPFLMKLFDSLSIPWVCESDIWSGAKSIYISIFDSWFVETSTDC